MNQALDKKKIIVLVVICLITTLGAGIYGSLTAGEMALSWLNLTNYEVKITTIFDLIKSINESTPKATKGYILGAAGIGLVITLIPLILFIAVFFGLKQKEEIYGSASFAKDLDIRKAGLLPTPKQRKGFQYPSILIGKYKDKFLHFAGQQFLYLAAPTRSGKGVGIVIPNLLNYADSVVCVDIKFENFYLPLASVRNAVKTCFYSRQTDSPNPKKCVKTVKSNHTTIILCTISAVI